MALLLGLCGAAAAAAAAATATANNPAIRRIADRPDGAPAFVVFDSEGRVASRVDCFQNGYVDADALATRFMGSTRVMAAVLAKRGRIDNDDLGPAIFDCVVTR